MVTSGEEFLRQLQSEAEESGFHKKLSAWVDDKSEAARVLLELDERKTK